MKPAPEELAALAKQVAEAETSLQKLEWAIKEIGEPAAHELQHRLDALRIEERALQRNLSEALGMDEPDDARMAKIEALLAYIQREETSVGWEAEFLHQSPPTSAELAAQAGSHIFNLCLRAVKRILGDHHPLGMSVFVNHSPQLLAERYGLNEGRKTADAENS